jgi:hypothetical protein
MPSRQKRKRKRRMAEASVKTPEINRGLGGLAATGSRDTRLIARAVREQWAIPTAIRPAIVARQVRAAIEAKSDREATQAARCLVQMQAQNQSAAFKALDKAMPIKQEVSHNIAAEMREAVKGLIADSNITRLAQENAVTMDEHQRSAAPSAGQ